MLSSAASSPDGESLTILSSLRALGGVVQVCNLAWSKTLPELVSTHGYSLNHVNVWRYPTMQTVPLDTRTHHVMTLRPPTLSLSLSLFPLPRCFSLLCPFRSVDQFLDLSLCSY